MESSFELSPLNFSMLASTTKGVPLLDLSIVSLPEVANRLKKASTEAILPKCNWKVSKNPQNLLRPKRLLERPNDTLEISLKQQNQREKRVNEIKERLMATYFKPRGIEKLAEVTSTPNIKVRIKLLPTKSIDYLLRDDKVTEFKPPKPLTMEEIFEKKVRKSLVQSKTILKDMSSLMEAKSIIHATLFKRNRLIEAFLDSCSNDLTRLQTANTIDQFGRTALHYASFIGLKRALSMLFIAGVDPRHRDVYGRTCLHYAAMNDDATIVEMILLNQKSVRETRARASEATNNNTVAEKLKYLSLLKLIAKAPEAVTDQPTQGYKETRIYLDLSELDDNMLRSLARMEYSEEIPSTPTYGGDRQSHDNIRLIDFQDEAGRTPLHIAAMNGATVVARSLIDIGSNLNFEDHQQKRPLDLTKSRPLAHLLIQRINKAGTNKSIEKSANASPDSR